MIPLQHNIVSILYALEGCLETYLGKVRQGKIQDDAKRLQTAEHLLQKSLQETQRVLMIAKKLKDVFSEQDTSGIPHSASLSRSWQRVLKSLRTHYSLAHIEIIGHIPEPFPDLQCKSEDLEQILYELAQNALQAMEGKGKLIIRAEMSFDPSRETLVMIKVSDTGPGIEPDKMPLLFEPFFSTKAEGRSNGLGLFVVQRLVRKNRGMMSVASYKGKGTSFSVEFPLLKPQTKILTFQAA